MNKKLKQFTKHLLNKKALLITFSVCIIGLMMGLNSNENARQQSLKNQQPLVIAADYCKDRIVAVGSYNFKKLPTISLAGSGFFVGDGKHVATNAHVIAAILKNADKSDLRVFIKNDPAVKDKRGRPATIVAIDELHDVAILKVAGPKNKAFDLDIKKPLTGRSICVMGYPIGSILGLEPLFHDGTVSAVVPAVLPMPRGVKLSNTLKKILKNPYNMYQLNIIMYPGNSGSALVDTETKKVVGIINSVMGRKTREHLVSHPTGISYAIPAKWIRLLLLKNNIPLN